MKKLLLGIALLTLVAIVLLIGATFIGMLPLLVFEDSINRTINKLADAITRA